MSDTTPPTNQPMRGMLATRIAVLSLASAAALGAFALAWQNSPARHRPPPESSAAATERVGAAHTIDRRVSADAARAATSPSGRTSAPASAKATVDALTAALGGEPTVQRIDRNSDAPTFDVARVEPDGAAVIAGRAAPGATVELLRGGEVHDRAVADQSGEFVLVPPRLPPGNYDLTLRSTRPGREQATSKDSITVALGPGKDDRPVFALVAPGEPTRVLSRPANSAATGAVAIHAVEAEASGKLYVSGRAAPGSNVRLYLNDAYLASATASADGRVAFAITSGVAPGDYRVRIDDVDAASGKVKSRSEVPFNVPASMFSTRSAVAAEERSQRQPVPGPMPGPAEMATNEQSRRLAERPPLPPSVALKTEAQPPPAAATAEGHTDVVVVPKIETAVVSRGDSLWRISRSTYGNGARYSVIYGANQDQIRDPNRIYPGQVFVLPKHVP
jgi:nucleoid-associated protein YgaU